MEKVKAIERGDWRAVICKHATEYVVRLEKRSFQWVFQGASLTKSAEEAESVAVAKLKEALEE